MGMRRVGLMAVMLGLMVGSASLGQTMPGGGGRGQGQRAVREYQRMQEQLQQLFDANDFEKAGATCEEILKKYPGDSLTLYNLACCQSRLKKPAEALVTLTKAVENGWSESDHMEADEDLAPIRGEKKFRELVEAAKINERAGGAKYEKGEEIAGVRTVEGFPE